MLLLSPRVCMLFWNLTSQCLTTNVLLHDFAINILLMLPSIISVTIGITLDAEHRSTLVLFACPVLDDPCHIIPVLMHVFSNPDCWLRF